MLSKQGIDKTYDLIKPYIYHTPLQESIYLSKTDRKIYFKNEGLQYTKSFKLRGALSKILRLTNEEKKKGVVAISSGNHGIAVAYICETLGMEATIFVPTNTPDSKCEKILAFGANLKKVGSNYDEAHAYGLEYLKKHDMTFVDSYDNDSLNY
jgi:threonine dehydratase